MSLAAVVLLVAGCSNAGEVAELTTSTGPSSAPTTGRPVATTDAPTTVVATTVVPTYADSAYWICRPDLADVCDRDTAMTDVSTDGTFTVRPSTGLSEPEVDCFYVYPTSSEDSTLNSDLSPGDELGAVGSQAAPFSDVCRVYAPLYRSHTVGALLYRSRGDIGDGYDVAYGDVLQAWRHYVSDDNAGRGVILVGHSQGSSMLSRLLQEEIDPSEAESRLIVSAFLAGPPDIVPDRYILLSDLTHLPPCRALDQIGCVVSFSTFRSATPPSADSVFARNRGVDGRSGCVNPASPSGGPGVLSSAFTSGPWALTDGSATPSTPYMDLPGLVTADCVQLDDHTYLAITVNGDPADPRADDIPGDFFLPGYGLHLVDIELTVGSLIAMARAQIAAYEAVK